MAISFDSLPQNASRFSIYGQAGRIFEEQVRNDPGTDYRNPEAFNTAIWYIAERARDRGFSALQGMSTQQVASDIGNQISTHGSGSLLASMFDSLPRSASRFDIYGQAGKIFEELVRDDPGTDYRNPEAFDTAIWYIAEEAQRRGFSALQGMSTQQIASGIGNQIFAYLNWHTWS